MIPKQNVDPTSVLNSFSWSTWTIAEMVFGLGTVAPRVSEYRAHLPLLSLAVCSDLRMICLRKFAINNVFPPFSSSPLLSRYCLCHLPEQRAQTLFLLSWSPVVGNWKMFRGQASDTSTTICSCRQSSRVQMTPLRRTTQRFWTSCSGHWGVFSRGTMMRKR